MKKYHWIHAGIKPILLPSEKKFHCRVNSFIHEGPTQSRPIKKNREEHFFEIEKNWKKESTDCKTKKQIGKVFSTNLWCQESMKGWQKGVEQLLYIIEYPSLTCSTTPSCNSNLLTGWLPLVQRRDPNRAVGYTNGSTLSIQDGWFNTSMDVKWHERQSSTPVRLNLVQFDCSFFSFIISPS